MATMGEITLFCCLFVAALVEEVGGSSSCFIGNSHYEVCEHGCCGSFPNEECCVNLTGIIIGVVVAAMVITIIVIVVVCIYMQIKSNQVVRMVQSAQSDRANITILHMNSSNPYEHASHPSSHMMSTSNFHRQPTALQPPDVPSGFQPNNPHPHKASAFSHPQLPHPSAPDADPAFPPGGIGPPGAGPGAGMMPMPPPMTNTSSEGTGLTARERSSMPSTLMNGGPHMMNGGPGLRNGASNMKSLPIASSENTGPGTTDREDSAISTISGGPQMMNGGPTLMPMMNGGPKGLTLSNGGPALKSGSSLPPIRMPLPGLKSEADGSDLKPAVNVFGGVKAGKNARAGTRLEPLGHSAGVSNMGVEDIEDIY